MTARRDSSNASRPAPAPAWPMPRGRRRGATVSLRLAMPPAVARRRCCRVVPIAAQRATTRRRDVAGAGRPLGGSRHAVLPRLAQQSMDRLLFSRVRNGLGHRARWRQPAARESALRGRATGGLLATGLLALGAGLCGLGPCGRDGQSVGEFLRHGPGAASGRLGAARVPRYRAVQAGLPLSFTVQARLAPNGVPETARPGNPYARTIMASSTAQTYFVRPSPSPDGRDELPPCSARIGRPGWLLPGLRRKARRAGHGDVPSACRATRAG